MRETTSQRCVRLVGALEDLAAEELANLRLRDFATVLSIQKRAAALVDDLVIHGPAVADESLRSRIAGVIARRTEAATWLATEIEVTRTELQSVETKQRRMARVAPVYGGVRPQRKRLFAVG
ncbi:MAG TPA: hypothetical protein VHE61_00815 [Opitutaceae bacterium]|nr:hypothetical protein [Opitutaceae bacterium]